jgi:hypothetical protein
MLAAKNPAIAMFESIAEDRRIEELKNILIVSYETAVDRGLEPSAALAAILEWAAQECARLSDG